MGSVLVNGSPTLEFQFHKVLKQGISLNDSFTISHLFYADDVVFIGIGVSSNVVADAASLIGCSILNATFNYLGVKVGCNMSRITSWDDVISKVSSRLSKWKLKLLSIGGRLSLLKSVLTSILLYHMSILKVPITVLNHLKSIHRNFFCEVDGSDWKLAWIGWNSVLTSKKNGGLGVFSFFAHNRALLFKMPRGDVEQENYGLLCSKVVDLVLPNISDRWCWSLEGSQEFSVKSSRILIDNTIFSKAEVPTRWLRVVPIKVNVHTWRVCLNKLPTRANLSLRGMHIPSIVVPFVIRLWNPLPIFFSLVPWLAKFGENF
nr:RNA-directed DNA polymerase, eukaryota [Tanacetum cinerariifolium]